MATLKQIDYFRSIYSLQLYESHKDVKRAIDSVFSGHYGRIKMEKLKYIPVEQFTDILSIVVTAHYSNYGTVVKPYKKPNMVYHGKVEEPSAFKMVVEQWSRLDDSEIHEDYWTDLNGDH